MIDVRLLTECKLGHHIGGGGGGSSSRRIASGVGGDAVGRRSRASRRDVAAGAGYVRSEGSSYFGQCRQNVRMRQDFSNLLVN